MEHPFRIIKRQFGFVKARYKGLLKNDNQLAMLFQGESVNILLNFTQFFETRIEYRFQIFTAHSCDFLLPSYARLA